MLPETSTLTSVHLFQPKTLVVLHVRGGGIELQVPLDDLVNRAQKVLLRCNLPPRTNSIHASLCAYTPKLSTSRVGAKTGDKFPSDVSFNRHALSMDS